MSTTLPPKAELLRKAVHYLECAEDTFDTDGDPGEVTNLLHFASIYMGLAEQAEDRPLAESRSTG